MRAAAGWTLVCAGLAVACRTALPNRPSPAPAAAVGINAGWVTTGSDTMLMTKATTVSAVVRHMGTRTASGRLEAAGGPGRVVVGTTIQSVRRVRGPGGVRLLEVAFEQRDGATSVMQTTTWVDAATLLPRRQQARLDDGRVVTLEYGGDRATGVDSAPGHPRRAFTVPVPDTAYTSGAIDLLLRALPLSTDYRATLPLYFPSEQLVYPVAVRVTGRDRITTRAGREADCWLVAAQFPGAITEQFWIEEHSHALLRILAHDGPMSLVRYDR